MKRLLFLVTEDWFFMLHRLPLAEAAVRAGYEVIVVTRVTNCREQLEDAGIKLIHIDWKRGSRNPFDNLAALIKIAKIYRLYRPEVIHHVSIKPVFIGTIACLFSGSHSRSCAVINNFTGLGTLFVSNELSDKLLRIFIVKVLSLLFRVKSIHQLVENEDDKRLLLQELQLPGDRVSVIHSVGVDLLHYQPTAECEGVPIVALVSRLIWDKGVGELVRAGEILRERGVAFRLALVGAPDSENRSAIPEATLKSWASSGLVELWGYRDDVDAVWRSVHIAVLPSYREGSPRALIEAAACGRPVVATDVPGCRDVVKHGETGYLVPSCDPVRLADALEKLICDPALRFNMGLRGRAYVESMFSQEAVITETFKVYATALGATLD